MKSEWKKYEKSHLPFISHLQVLSSKPAVIVALAFVEFDKTHEEAREIDSVFHDASTSKNWFIKCIWPLKHPIQHKGVQWTYGANFSFK